MNSRGRVTLATCATVASTGLLVLTALLWLAGNWKLATTSLCVGRHKIWCFANTVMYIRSQEASANSMSSETRSSGRWLLGSYWLFGRWRVDAATVRETWIIELPYWWGIVLFLPLPTWRYRRAIPRQLHPAQLSLYAMSACAAVSAFLLVGAASDTVDMSWGSAEACECSVWSSGPEVTLRLLWRTRPEATEHVPIGDLKPSHRWRFAGFSYGNRWIDLDHDANMKLYLRVPARVIMIGWPRWLIILATSVPPFLWLRMVRGRWRRARRLRRGLCVECGYDLRASVERCPECGLAIAPSKTRPRDITDFGSTSPVQRCAAPSGRR